MENRNISVITGVLFAFVGFSIVGIIIHGFEPVIGTAYLFAFFLMGHVQLSFFYDKTLDIHRKIQHEKYMNEGDKKKKKSINKWYLNALLERLGADNFFFMIGVIFIGAFLTIITAIYSPSLIFYPLIYLLVSVIQGGTRKLIFGEFMKRKPMFKLFFFIFVLIKITIITLWFGHATTDYVVFEWQVNMINFLKNLF